MKKQSIVIASILKPVHDTRMYEKMGQGLAATGLWNVHIIGFGERLATKEPNIVFHPLGNFPRISLSRIFAPLKILYKVIRIKPDAIIINTHELLLISTSYGILSGIKVFYDIRENYYLNISSTNAFPFGIKFFISVLVRCIEWMASPFIEHFILAEKNYATELPFIGKKFTIVENKCKLPDKFKRNPSTHEIRLLFSGTLNESTGIFEAIDLTKNLHAIEPKVKLSIIGYSAIPEVREKILEATSDCSYISIVGLIYLVDHTQIFEEISKASAGIIYYPPSPHTELCTPTKLYEYLCCALPAIYDTKATWAHLIKKPENGIAIDFHNPNHTEILKYLLDKKFNPQESMSTNWQWDDETFLEALT